MRAGFARTPESNQDAPLTWLRGMESNHPLWLMRPSWNHLQSTSQRNSCLVHRPGIEPGSTCYEQVALPLSYRCRKLERLSGIEPAASPWQGDTRPIAH